MRSTNACNASGVSPCFCAVCRHLLRVPLGLELLVALADGLLVERLAGLQRADVLGDRLALVEELGVRLDQPDELLAAHLLLLGILPGEAGDQAHDVVVVDQGRGEEDELEIELIDVVARLRLPVAAGPFALFAEPLGGFEVLAAEALELVLRTAPARWSASPRR